ncbi:MAG: PAS domain S-box protein [Anaerolineales bacterium]
MVEPAPRLADPVLRLKAQLLAVMHLLALPIIVFFGVPRELNGQEVDLPAYFGLATMVMLVGMLGVAYGLNRWGNYQQASGLTILVSILGPFLIVAGAQHADEALSILDYLIFSILASGLLLTPRATVLTLLGNLAGMVALAALKPDVTLAQMIDGPLRFVLIIGVLALLVLRYERLIARHGREQLRTSEMHFRTVSELTSDYAYSILIQADGGIRNEWMTEAFERITGYSPTARERENDHFWQQMVHPEDLPELRARVQRLRAGEVVTTEFRIIRPDGSIRWLRDVGRPDPATLGADVVRVYGAGHDITQARHTDDELALRDRAIAAINSGVTIADATQPDMPLIFANEAFMAITGYAYDEVIGQNCRFLQADDRDQAARAEIRRAIQQGRSCQVLIRNYRKDGTRFWNDFRMSPIFNEQGQLTHYVGIQVDVTARITADENLRRSEAEKTALLNAIPDLMLRYDAQGTILDCQAGDPTDLIFSTEALIGRNTRDVLDAENAAETVFYIGKALREGLQIYEYELQTQKGLASYEARMVPSGPDEVLCIVRNITQRKAAEKMLRERLEEMAMFQRVDHEIGYTLENDRILSLAVDLAMRRSLARGCTLAWRNDKNNQLEPLVSSGQNTAFAAPLTMQTVATTPASPLGRLYSGQDAWVQTPGTRPDTVSLWLGLVSRKRFHGVLLLEDIPAQAMDDDTLSFLAQLAHRTVAALVNVQNYKHIQQYAEAMDVLYARSKDLAASLEYDTIITISLRALLALLDVSSVFFIKPPPEGQMPSVIYAQSRTPTLPDQLNETEHYRFWLEHTRTASVSILLGSGAAEDARAVLAAMRVQSALALSLDREDEFRGAIVVCESRYERHFQDADIALARNLLSHMAVALQRAQVVADLQELEQVKSEMIRMASHDLRNPIAQIKGYLDLLIDELSPDSIHREYTAAIERGARKMEHLLEDILNLERAESQQPDTWQALNIQPLLIEAVFHLASQARLKEIDFQASIPPELPQVIGNDVQIEQAIHNIINNAIKYTPSGGQVIVEARTEAERLVFQVKDTGYGIPQERQARLFQRFYRANTPGTEGISGTGLGLSLVKAIIERHGGNVFFMSEYQAGSTFGFWLPLAPNGNIKRTGPND